MRTTDDLGGRLQRAREERGLSLHDAAGLTKLSIDILQAIERNDFDHLPGGMYRKAYLRTFAAEVGLDPAEIAAEYSRQFEPAQPPPPEVPRDTALHQELIQQLSAPQTSRLTFLALLALAAGWFIFSPALIEPAVPPVGSPGTIPLPAVPVNADTLSDGFQPVVMAADTTGIPLRIEVAAHDWCWIAAEADGRRVIYRLVEPDERLTVEALDMISLRLGNAGAVTVSVNNGEGQSPGDPGEVVELEFTSPRLHIPDSDGRSPRPTEAT